MYKSIKRRVRSKGDRTEGRQRMKAEESKEGKQNTKKEKQRKLELEEKGRRQRESKRQTRQTERESRGYAKKDMQRRKVESRIQGNQNTGKERLERVGWQDLKRLK